MAKRKRTETFGRGRRRIGVLGWALRGAAAGAAGTTALNAVTYVDMAVRGRGSSTTPQLTVEQIAGKANVPIPGGGEQRQNRIEGLGPLMGLAGGVAVGAAAGLVRAAGVRTRPLVGIALTTIGAMVPGNGPMALLGITDPRNWSAEDWLGDVVPHLAYGVVVKTTMDAFGRP